MYKNLADIKQALKNTIIKSISPDVYCNCGTGISDVIINPAGFRGAVQCSNCHCYIVTVEDNQWLDFYRYYDADTEDGQAYLIKKTFYIKLKSNTALFLWEHETWLCIEDLKKDDIELLEAFFRNIRGDDIRYLLGRFAQISTGTNKFRSIGAIAPLIDLDYPNKYKYFYELLYYMLDYYPLEAMLKTGFAYLIKDYHHFILFEMKKLVENGRENKISRIIGIPKGAIHYITRNECSLQTILSIKWFIHEHGYENFLILYIETGLFNLKLISNLGELLRYNYSSRRLVTYIGGLIDERGEDAGYWLSILSDIICISERIEYPLKKYPADPLAYHNSIMAKLPELEKRARIILDRKLLNIHNRLAPALKQVEDSEYVAVLPVEYNDFVAESNALRHCVKDYARRMVNNDTLIIFIRYRDRPPGHYLTIEIIGNRLHQARKKYNASPGPADKEYLRRLCRINGWGYMN